METLALESHREIVDTNTNCSTCYCKSPLVSTEKEKSRLRNLEEFNLNNLCVDDARLVSIAKLAALICKKPVGLINIVSEDQVTFFARFNFKQGDTPRENSFCRLVIEQEEIFEVKDTLLDHRFEDSEFVNT
jgi:hypothetical protein